jgi:hypothetical protein
MINSKSKQMIVTVAEINPGKCARKGGFGRLA